LVAGQDSLISACTGPSSGLLKYQWLSSQTSRSEAIRSLLSVRATILCELEARYLAQASSPTIDHSRRIAELDRDVRNITDAIAKGSFSDALASRLQEAEAERNRLQGAQMAPLSEPRKVLQQLSLQKRAALMKQRLAKGGDIARGVLREVFPESIWLEPDGSGSFMYAYFDDGCRTALFDQEDIADIFPIVRESACVVAGARFATYLLPCCEAVGSTDTLRQKLDAEPHIGPISRMRS
jgi:hypothetical protein